MLLFFLVFYNFGNFSFVCKYEIKCCCIFKLISFDCVCLLFPVCVFRWLSVRDGCCLVCWIKLIMGQLHLVWCIVVKRYTAYCNNQIKKICFNEVIFQLLVCNRISMIYSRIRCQGNRFLSCCFSWEFYRLYIDL